jgi:lipopolysaccharide transport system ATP-binding protein
VIRDYHESPTTAGPRGGTPVARRDWHELGSAPGNDLVRLRSVRVRTVDGETTNAIDIRRPVGIELEYEVLESGHVMIPNFHFINDQGLHLFVVQDVASEWCRRPRPTGRYVSTAWIPGNFLAPGGVSVDAAMSTNKPLHLVHAYAPTVVSFQVVDHFDGDAARGDYLGDYPGVVRPMVDWSTRVEAGQESAGVARGVVTTA